MKQFSKRFTAHMFWNPDNQRFELRLLPTPAMRYRDTKRGVTDGMIFLFARNINPEICLMIESVESNGNVSWQYGIAKIGSAEFHVELDGEEVWQSGRAPGVVGRPQDPYAMFFSNRAPTANSILQQMKKKLKQTADQISDGAAD